MALKLATLTLAVGGATTGYAKYRDQRERELTEKFREHQLELYLDGASAAATLATATDPLAPATVEARAKFLTLYWGPMSVVEDSLTLPAGAAFGPVEQAMVRFGAALAKCGIADPTGAPLRPFRGDGQCAPCLHDLSLDLAHTFRHDVQEEWRLTLPQSAEDKGIQACQAWADQ